MRRRFSLSGTIAILHLGVLAAFVAVSRLLSNEVLGQFIPSILVLTYWIFTFPIGWFNTLNYRSTGILNHQDIAITVVLWTINSALVGWVLAAGIRRAKENDKLHEVRDSIPEGAVDRIGYDGQ